MANQEFIESISLPNEEWRDVVGYEDFYMVSSFGRVCSLRRKVNVGNGGWRFIPQSILKPHPIKIGNYTRYCVNLWKNNIVSQKKVHRLVATAFIPNPCNYLEVDHIDTNTSNNSVTNLRWCNRTMNANNPITKEKNSIIRIGKPILKLQKPIVQLLDGYVIATFSCIKDASKFGFNKSQISMCCNKKRATHKGYKWMFLSDYEALISMSKNPKTIQMQINC